MGELRIIGKNSTVMIGDQIEEDLIIWSKDKKEEVMFAQKTFVECLSRGWLAIGEKSGKKAQIFTFDPDLEKIILAPIVMGG